MVAERSWRDQSFHFYHPGLISTVAEKKNLLNPERGCKSMGYV
jgi:hypothetical protein